MMSKEEFINLYEKSLRGECTPEELERLQAWSDDFTWQDAAWTDPAQQEAVYARLSASMAESGRIRRLFPWKRVAAAAAVLVLAVGGLFWMRAQRGAVAPQIAAVTTAKGPAADSSGLPGSNKAVLILSDGSEVTLNDAEAGQIARQGGALVSKTGQGQLVYDAAGLPDTAVVYNTIAIPRGGQYSLTLPDGTRIWLNADSRLRFPVRFSGNERPVELEGEAYFEVAANPSKPFRVKVRGLDVEVLGTHFNISAYADEKTIHTTLLEGKVRLRQGAESLVLSPGWQAKYTPGVARMQVFRADVDQVMAWKNGMFIFNDEELPSIMRKIARWYNVDVRYENRNSNLSYAGSMSRFKNVRDVLNMLALTGTVRFNVEGNVITVIN
jgi:ferric-dicitrate binding protein FerR (iron transport regulator)